MRGPLRLLCSLLIFVQPALAAGVRGVAVSPSAAPRAWALADWQPYESLPAARPLELPASALAAPLEPAPAAGAPAAAESALLAQVLPALAGRPAPAAPAPAPPAHVEERRSEPTALESLEAGDTAIERAGASGEAAALGAFFDALHLPADQSAPAPRAKRTAAAAAALRAAPAATADREAAAKDPSLPEAERRVAIAAIARVGGPEAVAALRRVAEAHPEGGALEYEIHRAALQALRGLGVALSLRPVTRAHADELLASMRDVETAVFDYDDTVEKHAKPVSPEIGAAIAAADAAGKDILILTERPDVSDNPRETLITSSLEPLTADQKGALAFSARGSRFLLFDRESRPVLVHEEDVRWDEKQREALLAASRIVAERYGRQEYNGVEEKLDEIKFVRFMPIGMPVAELEAAAELFEAELLARGVEWDIEARVAKDPKNPPYLSASRMDKSIGVAHFRANASVYAGLRALLRLGLPASRVPLARRVLGWASRLYSRAAPAKRTLLVGDSASRLRPVDKHMRRGAPGAAMIAVGGEADPEDDVFLWPTQGREASLEVLGALARKSRSRTRARAGLFAQRSVSIVAFLMVAIAYPFIAIPAVGWTGYGVLMSMGTMAAIATGRLSGRLVDVYKTGAMWINFGIAVPLLLVMPALWMLGAINFVTLLFPAIAQGYLLSSIATTENALVRQMEEKGRVQSTIDLLMINFFALQVFFGLILGVGRVADAVNPVWAYVIAAALNAFVAAPIAYFTLPRLPRDERSARLPGIAELASRALASLKRYRLEAALFVAAAASYPLLATPLPMAAALVFWIARTDAFRSIWRGDANESDPGQDPRERHKLVFAMLFSALGAAMFYPIQYFTLAKIAETLSGEAKGLLHGQLLGSLFLGSLLALAARVDLPSLRAWIFGRLDPGRLVQAGVLALAFTWIVRNALPGNWLAAAAAALGVAGLMSLAARLTDRGWLQLLGVGFASIWLPYLVWSVPALAAFLPLPLALSISMLLIGMFYSPASSTLFGYLGRNTRREMAGTASGIQGSFFNAAISIGYGLLTLASGLLDPAFPATLAALGVAFLVGGLLFWRSPAALPGLAETRVKKADANKS